MRLVEGDEVGERARLDGRRRGGEIGSHVRLQLGEEDGVFVLSDLVAALELGDFDEGGALVSQHLQGLLERLVGAEAGGEAHHANPFAVQRSSGEVGGEIPAMPVRLGGGRVGRIGAGDDG